VRQCKIRSSNEEAHSDIPVIKCKTQKKKGKKDNYFNIFTYNDDRSASHIYGIISRKSNSHYISSHKITIRLAACISARFMYDVMPSCSYNKIK